MQTINQILSSAIRKNGFPLAFQKIEVIRVMPHEVEKKISFYNSKYKHFNHQAMASKKPISKIV